MEHSESGENLPLIHDDIIHTVKYQNYRQINLIAINASVTFLSVTVSSSGLLFKALCD